MKTKPDITLVDPFLKGTVEVMKIQCQTEAKAGHPFLKTPHEPMIGDISGIIGLTSDAFNGTVVITFPEKTFLTLMSRMLGEVYSTITPEIQDGATELTNMVFGHAKRFFTEKGYKVKMAIPTLISGKNHNISNSKASSRVAIPFESTAGLFAIEIFLDQDDTP